MITRSPHTGNFVAVGVPEAAPALKRASLPPPPRRSLPPPVAVAPTPQTQAQRAPDALDQALDLYLAHLRVERGLLPATLDAYARDLVEYLAWLR